MRLLPDEEAPMLVDPEAPDAPEATEDAVPDADVSALLAPPDEDGTELEVEMEVEVEAPLLPEVLPEDGRKLLLPGPDEATPDEDPAKPLEAPPVPASVTAGVLSSSSVPGPPQPLQPANQHTAATDHAGHPRGRLRRVERLGRFMLQVYPFSWRATLSAL